MPTPTIPNGEEHFFPIIYEGNGGGQRVGKFVPFTDQATIANSVIFNRADNPYMYFDKSGITPDSDKKFTFSCWFKIGEQGSRLNTGLFNSNTDGSNGGNVTRYAPLATFTSDGKIFGYDYDSGGYNWYFQTNRTFEDTSKWYHFVLAIDTTQSTSTDRMKVYIDGDQITSFLSSTYPALNQDLYTVMAGGYHILGLGYNAKFDGYLAEVNLIENQQLTPSTFGVTDTSTGRWIPKTVEPFPTTTTDIAVTVVSSGGNKFAVDGVTQGTVTLIEGATYKFDQSDSSNATHPLRFSTTSDGTHNSGTEYTTGVTTVGTPGSSGAYTQITVATGAPTLYYYCSSHSGMGGTANTQDQYGTNGFRLTFADSSAFGDDTSGNTNDFTATNLASTDQTTDSPTQNHCIMDSNITAGSPTLAEGNTKITGPSSDYGKSLGTLAFDASTSTGYYWEVTFTNSNTEIGIMNNQKRPTASNSSDVGATILQARGGGGGNTWWFNQDDSELADTGVTHSSSHRIQVAVKNGNIWFGYNNTWFLSGNPSTGANPAFTGLESRGLQRPYFAVYDAISMTIHMNDDDWSYTPPTGFVALQQDNLPATDKGISGFSWVKNRDQSSNSHGLTDSSRGASKVLFSNTDDAQQTYDNGLTKFLKGGYACGEFQYINGSGDSLVSWNWVGNSGTTSSNTDGSISSTVQANTTAGFSIVQYTGTGSAGTVGHGLSSAPEWVMAKVLNVGSVSGFTVGCTADPSGFNNFLYLNETEVSRASSSTWNDTAPTSSVFSVGSSSTTNYSSQAMLAYCWHSVDGYSKFGSYEGNASSDGRFVYTGFKPAFLMIKDIDNTRNWIMIDNARDPFNPTDKGLASSNSNAENTGNAIDFLSNGFKFRSSSTSFNTSSTYIYMAFAEHPFVGDGTSPVTAR